MSEKKTRLERREFLKLGAAGLAASALAGCATTTASKKDEPAASGTPAAKPAPAPVAATAQNRRTLGRTGITLPVVSMGVMNADNPNLVRAALDGGMLMLDTAHVYQNGRNEEMVGTVIKDRKRDSYTLCTKIFLSTLDRKTGIFSPETRPEELEEKLAISLKRLGVDYVDVLYLHNQSLRESALMEPLLRGLSKIKKDGKARFLGLSTHKNEPDVIRAAIDSKVYDVVLTSYNFKQDHHLEVEKAIGEAAAAGLGVVAMKTQAGVFWDKEKKNPINPRAALKWALRNPTVHTAIPGFTTLEQLQIDLDVLRDPVMTDEEKASLEPPKVAGFYCQGCESCRGPCPEGLPIPELMRSYMYAHAYRNREAAHDLVTELKLPASVCTSCESCSVTCAKGFDVRERVRDIIRLRDVPREFLI
jgi:predicted aldo/keto reductase-like oxidoreductase